MALTGAIVDWSVEFIGDRGVPAVFVLMALESACIPIPSEAIQLFAGFLVAQGSMGFVAAVAAGSLGNLAVGAYGGRPLLERHGRWLHVTPGRLDAADRWFERYGNRIVFWGRMVPVVRTFVSLPAGVARMPFGRFALYTLLGSIPWCVMLTLVGIQVGANWHDVEGHLKVVDYLVAAGLVALVAAMVVRRRRRVTADGRP